MHPAWRRAYARSSLSNGGQLAVERIDRPKRDRDLLARRDGQRLSGEPLAPVASHQLAALRAAVVIQRRLDPLLPLPRCSVSVCRNRARPHPPPTTNEGALAFGASRRFPTHDQKGRLNPRTFSP